MFNNNKQKPTIEAIMELASIASKSMVISDIKRYQNAIKKYLDYGKILKDYHINQNKLKLIMSKNLI